MLRSVTARIESIDYVSTCREALKHMAQEHGIHIPFDPSQSADPGTHMTVGLSDANRERLDRLVQITGLNASQVMRGALKALARHHGLGTVEVGDEERELQPKRRRPCVAETTARVQPSARTRKAKREPVTA